MLHLNLDMRGSLDRAVACLPFLELQPVHIFDFQHARAVLRVHIAQHRIALERAIFCAHDLVIEARAHFAMEKPVDRIAADRARLHTVSFGDAARNGILQPDAPLHALAGLALVRRCRLLDRRQLECGHIRVESEQCGYFGAADVLMSQRKPFVARFRIMEHLAFPKSLPFAGHCYTLTVNDVSTIIV